MDHDSDMDYLQRLVDQARHGLKLCNRVAQQLRTAVTDVHNTVDGIDKVVQRLARPLPADAPPQGVDQYAHDKDGTLPQRYKIPDAMLNQPTDPEIDGSMQAGTLLAEVARRRGISLEQVSQRPWNADQASQKGRSTAADTPPEAPIRSDDLDELVATELDELMARVDYMQAEMHAMQQAASERDKRSTAAPGSPTDMRRDRPPPKAAQRVLGAEEVAEILNNDRVALAMEPIDVHGDEHSDDFMRPVSSATMPPQRRQHTLYGPDSID